MLAVTGRRVRAENVIQAIAAGELVSDQLCLPQDAPKTRDRLQRDSLGVGGILHRAPSQRRFRREPAIPVLVVWADGGEFSRLGLKRQAAPERVVGRNTELDPNSFEIRHRPGAISVQVLRPVLGQPAFGLDGGLASHARGCDRLPVDVVGAIAGDEHAGDLGLYLAATHRSEVTVFVDVEGLREWLGVRHMTDGHEHALAGDHALGARLRILDLHTADSALLCSLHFGEDAVPSRLDLGVGEGALGHDFRRAQGVPPVDQGHLAGKARKKQRFLASRVAAAHHDHLQVPVEGAVAGRAGGHALSAKILFFTRYAHQPRRRAGGDDDGPGKDLPLGQLEKAKPVLEELYKGQPGNYEYFQALNTVYTQLKGYDASIVLIEDRMRLFKPGYKSVWHVGTTYYLKGNERKAFAVWDSALAKFSDSEAVCRIIANYAIQMRTFERGHGVFKKRAGYFRESHIFRI